jgi:hypothetical protein
VFTLNVVSGLGYFYSRCPTGYQLLSCGLDNTQNANWEKYRSCKASDSNTCQCYDYYGMACVAWCTTLPLTGFEIQTITSLGYFTASCSAGKQILGCHIFPNQALNYEVYRGYYPTSSGSYCTCYDYYGAECISTCSTQVKNQEVVSAYGGGYIYVTCAQPLNRVLGCGMSPNQAMTPNYERFRTSRVVSGNTCRCYDGAAAYCYAICGQIW